MEILKAKVHSQFSKNPNIMSILNTKISNIKANSAWYWLVV